MIFFLHDFELIMFHKFDDDTLYFDVSEET